MQPIDLKPFCADEDGTRYILSRPWLLDDGRIAACDGAVLAVVDSAIDAPTEVSDYRAPNVKPILAPIEKVTEWHLLPEPVECAECGSTGMLFVECDVCKGTGECICPRCDDRHRCNDCEGKKGSNTYCDHCHLHLGTRRVNRVCVDKFRALDGVVWGTADDDDPYGNVFFRFAGGQGVLRPTTPREVPMTKNKNTVDAKWTVYTSVELECGRKWGCSCEWLGWWNLGSVGVAINILAPAGGIHLFGWWLHLGRIPHVVKTDLHSFTVDEKDPE